MVHRVARRQEPETLDRARHAVALRHARREPAHRAGADAAQHDPALPRLPQDGVDAVRSPDREQVEQRAATRVDHVLAEQQHAQVDGLRAEAEERKVGGLTGEVVVGAVEALDLLLGIAARRGQEADARVGPFRHLEHVAVESGVAARGRREAAAAHRDDPSHAIAATGAAPR
jgi:hypothetical protein